MIYLHKMFFSSILIQGRYGNGLGQEFAEFFAFDYRSSIDQQYIRYTDKSGISVLPANINTFQVQLRYKINQLYRVQPQKIEQLHRIS